MIQFFFLSAHREKKLSHFDLKSWVTGGITIRPGQLSNWRIFESILLSMLSQLDSQCWANFTLNVEPIILSMLSQFDSNILQLPNLPGRILVRQVTQLFMSKWLNFFSLCIIACRHNYSELDDATPQSIKISALVYRYQILEYFYKCFVVRCKL